MALLKRAGLFSSDTHGALIHRATRLEDLLAAYRLTHDVFVRQGYIHPDPSGIRIRAFEALPETATFIARTDTDVVGVTSVVQDSSDLGLPADHAFQAELDQLRSEGRVMCEGTNWLVADSHRSSAVMSELMRCSFAHACWKQCTDFVGAVSPGHAKFYQLLGFEIYGAQRSYSREIEDPVVLVRMDLTSLEDRFRGVQAGMENVESFLKGYYIEHNPYHRNVATWQIVAERLFADPTLLHLLFVSETGFLPRCDARTLDTIALRWKQVPLTQVYKPAQVGETC